jgi:long-chain acyl-CoA synthetase
MSTDAAMTTAAAGTVVEHFLSAMERHAALPLARAHRDGGWRDTTFGELRARVERVACGLAALGVEPGDRVALLARTRPEWTACDYGIQCAGATVVPIYPSSTAADCLHILRDSGAVVAIVEDAEHAAVLQPLLAGLPDLRELVLVDPPDDPRVTSLADLERRGADHLAGDPGAFAARTATVRADDPCTFVYTSGTTGPPKGCVILHRNYRAMIEMTVGTNTFVGEGSVVYLYLPLAHVFARLTQYHAVAVGAVIAYTRGVERIADDLLETRPDVLPSVPRVFEKVRAAVLAKGESGPALRRRLFAFAMAAGDEVGRLRERRQAPGRALALKHALADRLVLSKVRERLGGRVAVCVSGGAPIAPDVLRFFHACGLLVLEGYGLSESSTAITINRVDDFRFGTVGLPFPGGEVRIAEDGEVLYRGPNVFAGYHGLPDETSHAIVDGWLHTGDVGRLDPDGFLEITDRKKDIIVTAGGKNVAPANIENDLRGSPLIAEAFVVGDRRPYLVALVTVDREAAVSSGAVPDDLPLDAVAEHPAVAAAIGERVAAVNAERGRSEQIRRHRILPVEFTQEGGELTPTLKLKRRVVLERFGHEIDALYGTSPRASGSAAGEP